MPGWFDQNRPPADFLTPGQNVPPQAVGPVAGPEQQSIQTGMSQPSQSPSGGAPNYGNVQSATGTMDPEIIKRAIHDAGIAQGRSEADMAATAEKDVAYWTPQIQAKGGLSQYWLDRLKTGNQPGGGSSGGGGGYGTGSFNEGPPDAYQVPTFKQPGAYQVPTFKQPAPFVAPSGLTEANDPGFQARMKMGTDAIQGAAAAKGSVLSGGTLKALERYGQDYGSNEYGQVYGRALKGYDVNTTNDWRTQENQAQYGQTGYALNTANDWRTQENQAQYGQTGYQINLGARRGAQQDYWGRLQDLYSGGQRANQQTYQRP